MELNYDESSSSKVLFPRYLSMHKTPKISVNDIDCKSKKIKINSPRSLTAMNKLGINSSDLNYVSFKEYLTKNPDVKNLSKKYQRLKYDFEEDIRKKKINQIKNMRSHLTQDEIKKCQFRCFSSKFRSNKSIKLNSSRKREKSTATLNEKDAKFFNRMRNVNQVELLNKLQIELKKELNSLIREEKEEEKIELYKRNKQILEKKIEYEKNLKFKTEEENMEREKQIDRFNRKLEQKRIQEQIKDELRHAKYLKLETENENKNKIEEEIKKINFRKKLDLQNEIIRLKLVAEAMKKDKRCDKNRKKAEKEKEMHRKEIENKVNTMNAIVKKNLKEKEIQSELKRILYEENERIKRDENDTNTDPKNVRQYEIDLRKKIKKIGENDELIMKKILKDFDKKRNELKKKKEYKINMIKIKEIEKQEMIKSKEEKMKEILLNNELIMMHRKEDIINRINEREEKNKLMQNMKQIMNEKKKEERMFKTLKKEYKAKEIAKYLEQKREKTREELLEKDRKVESFLKKKNNFGKDKKLKYEELEKEKKENNDKIEKILNKKSIDKNMINEIKDMFPSNPQINELLKKINDLLDKKEKNFYSKKAQKI